MGAFFQGRVPRGAVYVGRRAPGLPQSRWANEHRIGVCRVCGGEKHDRPGAIAAYVRDLQARPELVEAARRDLAGRDLACWCRLDQQCHADVLLAVAAGQEPASTP